MTAEETVMKKRKSSSSILEGIKNYARFLKKRDGIPLHTALNRASLAAGFQSLRHARNSLRDQAGPRHQIFITSYWIDGATRGRETLELDFGVALTSLVTPAILRKKGSLRVFRMAGPDHLVRREPAAQQEAARRAVCHVARVLQFISATGLQPADDAWRRALPGVPINQQLPGADHSSIWMDPRSNRYLFVDEPYGRAAPFTKAGARAAWAKTFDFDIVESPWPGMYFPDGGSRLYFVANKARGVLVAPLVAAMRALPAPIVPDPWTGMSGSFSPRLMTPGERMAKANKTPRKTPTMRSAPGPRVTVGYVQSFVGRRRRPNSRMPIEVHEEVSALLNGVRAACISRAGVANRLDHVRSDLDEWVAREYSASELAHERFSDLYYPHEPGLSIGVRLHEAQARSFIDDLTRAKQRLSDHYPNCEPVRALLRGIDGAVKSLLAWSRRSSAMLTSRP